jgi:hypothetical protein
MTIFPNGFMLKVISGFAPLKISKPAPTTNPYDREREKNADQSSG